MIDVLQTHTSNQELTKYTRVICSFSEGGYRQLFVREQLVWGKEGASSIYARGRQLGMNLIDSALTNIRELVEDCEILDGFILSHSHGGGTGSGLTSLLLERLRDEYHDKHLINFAIQPSQHISTAVVEPYNAILAMYDNMSIDNIATILLDNEAISNICNHLHDSPTGYTNMNHLISQCISSLTTGPRFGGKKQKGLIDTVSNLVPYPRIHYATTSYAPVISAERNRLYPPSVDEMTDACFSASNQMLKCQPSRGKYISGCIFGRGIEMGDLARAAENTKVDRGVQQVDYSPSAFVLDTSERLPKNVSGSDLADVNQDVCMFSNTTAISETWKPLVREFDLMFPKRAFVHHYEEAGTEKHDFEQARDGMAKLLQNYQDISWEA